MELEELEIYKIAKEISIESWKLYEVLSWQNKKIVGDQFIRSVDSIGANIAEGFGRYHYLDKNKFNYNARGSLLEASHWLSLLKQRGMVDNKIANDLEEKLKKLHRKLNAYIRATKKQKIKKK